MLGPNFVMGGRGHHLGTWSGVTELQSTMFVVPVVCAFTNARGFSSRCGGYDSVPHLSFSVDVGGSPGVLLGLPQLVSSVVGGWSFSSSSSTDLRGLWGRPFLVIGPFSINQCPSVGSS